MTSATTPARFALLSASVALAASLAFAATPSQAQYKVIGADGKVTYSDREPNPSEGRVSALGARGSAPAAEPDLPFELRQIVSKYPVTLYTASGSCDSCVAARQLLKQRGIPFSERQVVTEEDNEALERLSGSRDVPTLAIGAQVIRGLSSEQWISYLDAAGYPRDSRLPASYQYRPATPIVDRREPAVARSPAAPGPAPQAPAIAAPAGAGGVRF
jgi:glutaredoxin